MVERRTLRRWSYATAGAVGAAVIMFLPELVGGGSHGPGGGNVAPDRVACVVLGIAWAAVFGVLGFLSSDEYARERSKFAWYWGSFGGLAASAPIVAFVAMGGLRDLGGLGAMSPQLTRAIATGCAIPIAAQMVGFLVVRLWWKAARS